MINGHGGVILEKNTVLYIRSVRIGVGMIRAPGNVFSQGPATDEHDRIIRRKKIPMVQRIEMPAGFQLFEVAQAIDGAGFVLGPRKRRQQHCCQNSDNRDHNQQLD
jgi:hypothetical protein